jgi:Mycothiol maleylpyruvate isomerase N-terminal domain
VRIVASGRAVDAFGAEAARLSGVVLGVDEAVFWRESTCPPWSAAELLYHVIIGVGRVSAMLAEPEPPAGPVMPAAGYFRPNQRFAPEANRDRIAAAQRGAAGLGTGSAIAREFDLAWRRSWTQAQQAPQARLVRTRHGDTMLLAEFLRTRVLEVAVHGLDLAASLGRPPWTTEAAARVVEDLMLPAGTTALLLDESGWDHATLVAKATGRRPLSEPDAALLARHGLTRLCLG